MAIDVDLLRAWYAGFPFGVEAYEQTLYRLDRTDGRSPTRALAHAADRWVSVRARGRSIDGLSRLRDDVWFGAGETQPLRASTTLACLLTDIAEGVLDYDGVTLVVRQRGRGRDAQEATDHAINIARFRWLTLVFPQDVLVAAYCAKHQISPRSIDVRFGSVGLERLLAAGVSETHLHASNGVDALFVWKRWLRSLSENAPSALSVSSVRCSKSRGGGPVGYESDLDSDPFAPPLGSKARLERAGLAAAVLRVRMSDWFEHKLTKSSSSDGVVRSDDRCRGDAFERARAALLMPCKPPRDPQLDRILLREELIGQLLPRHAERLRRPRGNSALFEDTLERRVDVTPADGRPDREFAFTVAALRCLLLLERDGGARRIDPMEQLFWQYLRLRIAVFRYMTQEPGVPGLDWFRIWDHRLKLFYSRRARQDAVGNAFRLHTRGVSLKSIEVRGPPECSEHDMYSLLRRTLDSTLSSLHGLSLPAVAAKVLSRSPIDGASSIPPCEVGLVLHFVKKSPAVPRARRGRGAGRSLRPELPRELIRHDQWLRDALRDARVIDTMFRRHPLLVVLLRGFDVASRELSMPTWPTLLPLAQCKRSSIRALEQARKRYPQLVVSPLRMTYHAGEDYRRSVEGLRRVHELIEFGAIGANDRIGHGIALGDDLDRRHREQPVVYQPAEDRLDDLLWEFDRYRDGDIHERAGRANVVRGEIDHLVRKVIYQGTTPDAIRDLVVSSLASKTTASEAAAIQQWLDRTSSVAEDHADARRQRHDPALIAAWVRRLGRQATPTLGASHPLVARYLADREVARRGQIVVRVESSEGELQFLKAAQRWLRVLIASRQITIESNPSSNLLVGDFQSFPELATFRMHPLPSQKSETATLSLSINTDDPLTFATNLGNEYEYMFAALLRANIPSEEALAWINSVRECGVRSRFTIAASERASVLARLRHNIDPYRSSDTFRR
jgi:hypothetical protein